MQYSQVRYFLLTSDPLFASRLQKLVDIDEYSHKLSDNALFAVVESEGDIAGLIAFYKNDKSKELYVPYVCVSEKHRGKGLADKMMASVCEYADELSYGISLEVLIGNEKAINLYKKYGLEIVDTRGEKHNMRKAAEGLLVSIRCVTYNHASYIRQCLDGFIMQKTSFRFEAIVHDDASVDGTAEIIREYAERYPDIIKPILETENQYSKHDGSLARIMNANLRGKYVAFCEGDDYWTDPLKLQKQVDYLETHPECVMCCSDADIMTSSGVLDWSRYSTSRNIPVEDVIIGGGLFLNTASLVLKRCLLNNDIPLCHVGDYPLQIYAALSGKVYYFAEKQVVYRYQVGQSWTSTVNMAQFEKKVAGWQSEISMLKYLDDYSKGMYSDAFIKRMTLYISNIMTSNRDYVEEIADVFSDVVKMFNFKQRLKYYLLKYNLDRVFNMISVVKKTIM